jgi:hypothetical protein
MLTMPGTDPSRYPPAPAGPERLGPSGATLAATIRGLRGGLFSYQIGLRGKGGSIRFRPLFGSGLPWPAGESSWGW